MVHRDGEVFEDIIEQLHDQSMSKDPEKAMDGRISKALYTAIDRIMEDELKRNSHPGEFISCLSQNISIILVSQAATLVKKDRFKQGLSKMGEMFSRDFERNIAIAVKNQEMFEQFNNARGKETKPCKTCNGTGTVEEQDVYEDGSPARSISLLPCAECNGTGSQY